MAGIPHQRYGQMHGTTLSQAQAASQGHGQPERRVPPPGQGQPQGWAPPRRDMAHHRDPSRPKDVMAPRDIPHFEDPSHHRAASHPEATFNNGRSHLTHPHVMHHSVTRLPFKGQRRQTRTCLVVGQRETITRLDLQASAAEGSRSWRKAIPERRRRRGVLGNCSRGSQ